MHEAYEARREGTRLRVAHKQNPQRWIELRPIQCDDDIEMAARCAHPELGGIYSPYDYKDNPDFQPMMRELPANPNQQVQTLAGWLQHDLSSIPFPGFNDPQMVVTPEGVCIGVGWRLRMPNKGRHAEFSLVLSRNYRGRKLGLLVGAALVEGGVDIPSMDLLAAMYADHDPNWRKKWLWEIKNRKRNLSASERLKLRTRSASELIFARLGFEANAIQQEEDLRNSWYGDARPVVPYVSTSELWLESEIRRQFTFSFQRLDEEADVWRNVEPLASLGVRPFVTKWSDGPRKGRRTYVHPPYASIKTCPQEFAADASALDVTVEWLLKGQYRSPNHPLPRMEPGPGEYGSVRSEKFIRAFLRASISNSVPPPVVLTRLSSDNSIHGITMFRPKVPDPRSDATRRTSTFVVRVGSSFTHQEAALALARVCETEASWGCITPDRSIPLEKL